MELALLTGRGGLGQDAAHARARRPGGRPLRGRDDPEPAPLAAAVPAHGGRASSGSRSRASTSNDLLDQIHERLLELDEAGPRRAPDRGRGAPHPGQAHLRGDPAPHELPARRPQPDRDRARGPAGAARAPAPPRLPGRSPSGSGPSFHLRAARRVEDTRAYLAPPAGGGRGARGRSSPTSAVAAPARGLGRASRACSTSSRRRRCSRAWRAARARWTGRIVDAVAAERDFDGVPAEGARVADMGRMADARKTGTAGRERRRQRRAAGGGAPADRRTQPPRTLVFAEEPRRRSRRAAGRAGSRCPPPASPRTSCASRRPRRASPRPRRVALPASGLAEDVLPRRADAPGGHSLSFFAAPAQEQRAAAEATEHLATFFLDREEYGVDVRQVQEIRRVTEITTVPRAPEFIRGVINLRGRILPVLDLKRKLGLGEVVASRATRIVVVRRARAPPRAARRRRVAGAEGARSRASSRRPRRSWRAAATTSAASPSSTTG